MKFFTKTSSRRDGATGTRSKVLLLCGMFIMTMLASPFSSSAQIAAWDFFGVSSPATSPATVFNANLVSTSGANNITRGAGATASTATNSFRTQGFQNNGISVANTDYFQVTLTAAAGFKVSLSTLDARFAGTATFYASPGVTSQYAYSLDGTNFTLIGSPLTSTSLTLAQISLTGISALQNVPAGTTVSLRYYASGQTTTGGWGYTSASAGSYGFAVGGTVISTATAPVVTTNATPSAIGTTTATLGGNVSSDGGSAVTSRGVVYSQTSVNATPAIGGSGVTNNTDPGTTGAFTVSATSLPVNTLISYRAYAINGIGTTYGGASGTTFYTLANLPNAPVVNGPTNNSLNVAIGSGDGNPSTTQYAIFETSTNSFIQANGALGATAVFQTAASWGTITVTGLSASAVYSFQVKARNGASVETAYGASGTGSTTAAASPVLTATALTGFGSVCINTTAGPNTFTINGTDLTSANITVSTLNGFTYSTDNITYTVSLSFTQPSGSFSQLVYVKFTPVAVQSYDGNITVAGGGAASYPVPATGSGINTAASVTTGNATAVTQFGATLNGAITLNGCTPVSAYGIEYSTLNGFANGAGLMQAGSNLSAGAFSVNLSGLNPGITYYYKAYATNAGGTSYGLQQSFATSALTAPVATAATDITSNSFTANWNAVAGAQSYRLDVSTSPTFTSSNATDLFISEYVEGSSNNKYIEVYNGTGAAVNLADYKLRLFANGAATPTSDIALTGTLANGSTIVYKNSAATIYAGAATINSATNFNGDDAVALYKVSTAANVDIFGRIGEDPGVAWTSGSFTTLDKTLVRNANVSGGVTINPASGFPTLATQWTQFNIDVVSNLGSHTYSVSNPTFVSGYNDLTVNGTSQSVTGLNPLTNYYYRVRAFSSTSTSANSNTISVQTICNSTITASTGANGSVSPAGASTPNCGDNATYTITPDACYHIADVLVDGVSAGAVGTYTFTNVQANHTISASFTLNTYTITATNGANGTVTPAGASTVNCGDNATYTITPAACYAIADVLVDGVSNAAAIASGTYTFNNVTANHTISATFVQLTYTITATSGANGTVTPAGASTVNCGDNATYTITPAACYAIADVLVDGVSNAAAIASGTYTFNNVTANHTISATFVQLTYTITATSGANGTVTPAGASTVNCGDNATYTITPAACYAIADVLVDGVSNAAAIASGTYTFNNVTANHTISATFVQTTYTITATSGANGTVTPAGASTINCGDNATYTITPAACYAIADVLVDGVSNAAAIASGTYTFNNVTANHTISATFVQTTYTITATSGANGTVTPAGTSTVNCGDNATYTITPAACYAIADVLVDGVSNAAAIASGTYTFNNVTANHTISATFVQTTYTITATSGANGTVTPAGASTVNCGDNATYTITPAACYAIADVLVDGVSNAAAIASGTYTFTNVTANHTISATFVQLTYTITATSGANGTVTPAGASTINCGDNATYTITPAACYAIADVLVDGVSNAAAIASGTYTFNNVTANHTISATFVQTTYTITATSGANGTVTPAGASTVNCGSNATYTITPAACYAITDVLVDGVSNAAAIASGTYTFNNVTANHTISATFVQTTYTITATSGANGTVTPAGASTVNCGSNATYTITPNAGYSIADVIVDGGSVGALATYTFTNVTANHTISATFVNNASYTITASAGTNGSIAPNGVTTVASGGSQSYTITPAGCYHVANVLVDGISVGAITTYTFSNVTSNHTISATFAINGPAATPVVTGFQNVCPYINNGQVTYTATSQGATGFTWVTPPNVTIVSGQGTANLTLTFQSGFVNQVNKQLRVTAISPCGNSIQVIYYLAAAAPATPQPITASSSDICPVIGTAGTIIYKIPAVVGATSYIWTTQSGTTIQNHPNGTGINDTLITVSFTNGFTTSAITVRAANDSCGASGLRSLTITRGNPSQPGLISGPTNACPYIAPDGTAASYSIAPVANATSYTWTAPGGAVITGQGTTMISFTFPSTFTSGSVTVTSTNGCGTSTIRSLAISKLLPGTPSNIDIIQTAACPDRIFTYSLSSMPTNSTSIQWTVPAGGTIISGQGTTSITVSYSTAAIHGNVTAQAVSNCGSSSIRTIAVNLPVCPTTRMEYVKGKTSAPALPAGMSVNLYPNPSVSNFNLQVETAAKEAINVRILDLQGREYSHFTVQPNQTTTLGSDLKVGAYMMEVKQGNEVKTSRLIKF